ncbi:MAG: hypothetical protein QMD76_07415 [Anaerosomatales bacterium]|nr:hypothetical protein [Anaerosomatales bacterium]GAV31393.1 hypothetical protein emb_1c0120 [Coriobacteriaceae bacterium EMTCatB1]
MAGEPDMLTAAGVILVFLGLTPMFLAPAMIRLGLRKRAAVGVVAGLLAGGGMLLFARRPAAAVVASVVVPLSVVFLSGRVNDPRWYVKRNISLIARAFGQRVVAESFVGVLGYGKIVTDNHGGVGVWHVPPEGQPHSDSVEIENGERVLKRVYGNRRREALESELAAAAEDELQAVPCTAHAREYAKNVLTLLPEDWGAVLVRSGLVEGRCTAFLPGSVSPVRAERLEAPWIARPIVQPRANYQRSMFIMIPARIAHDRIAEHLSASYAGSHNELWILRGRAECELLSSKSAVSGRIPIQEPEALASALRGSLWPLPLVALVVRAEAAVSGDPKIEPEAPGLVADRMVALVVGACDNEAFVVFERPGSPSRPLESTFSG